MISPLRVAHRCGAHLDYSPGAVPPDNADLFLGNSLPVQQTTGQGIILGLVRPAIRMEAAEVRIIFQAVGHGHRMPNDGFQLLIGQKEIAEGGLGNDYPAGHLLQHRAQQGPLGFQILGQALQFLVLRHQFLGALFGLHLQLFVGRAQFFRQLPAMLLGLLAMR